MTKITIEVDGSTVQSVTAKRCSFGNTRPNVPAASICTCRHRQLTFCIIGKGS